MGESNRTGQPASWALPSSGSLHRVVPACQTGLLLHPLALGASSRVKRLTELFLDTLKGETENVRPPFSLSFLGKSLQNREMPTRAGVGQSWSLSQTQPTTHLRKALQEHSPVRLLA